MSDTEKKRSVFESRQMNLDNLKSLAQALVLDVNSDNNIEKATLWVAPKADIVEALHLSDPEAKKVPSPGLELAASFASGTDSESVAARYAAQLMLKSRRLSQIWAQSWLEGEYLEEAQRLGQLSQQDIDQLDKARNKVLRQLFFTAMDEPDDYHINIPLNSGGNENADFKLLEILAQSESERAENPKQITSKARTGDSACNTLFALSQLLQSQDVVFAPLRSILSRVILPLFPAWAMVRFSLLISGQVFLTKDSGNSYMRLIEPVLSSYDVCVNYAFTEMDWYGQLGCIMIETPNPGLKFQKPGYYQTTGVYPPRPLPSDPTTTPKKIFLWATAEDEHATDHKFPFYPPRDGSGKFVSNYVDFISPPYPYLPVSSC